MRTTYLPTILLTALLAACSAAPAPFAVAQPTGATEAFAAAASRVRAPGVAGDVRLHKGVKSRHLAHSRDVWVYLPPGYDAAAEAAAEAKRKGAKAEGPRYPVLYMHDGNNLMDPALAFMGREWKVDESMEQLLAAKDVPPMIVVGIGNSADRLAEYTWVEGEHDGKKVGGDGAKHARFMIEELKPLIDRTYRTRTGRADTGVMGSSLGGLQSVYLGRHHGDVFGKLGVMSPSVWWSDRAVLAEPAKTPLGLRIWLDFGHREGGDPAAGLANARDLKAAFVKRGYAEGKDLTWWEDREGGHDERAWAYRFPIAVKALFGAGR